MHDYSSGTKALCTARHEKAVWKRLGLLVFVFDLLVALGGDVDLIGFGSGLTEVADGAAEAAADLRQTLCAEHDQPDDKDDQNFLRTNTKHK